MLRARGIYHIQPRRILLSLMSGCARAQGHQPQDSGGRAFWVGYNVGMEGMSYDEAASSSDQTYL